MNYDGDCRTAPATPGLLITSRKKRLSLQNDPSYLGGVCGDVVEDVDKHQEQGDQQRHSTW